LPPFRSLWPKLYVQRSCGIAPDGFTVGTVKDLTPLDPDSPPRPVLQPGVFA
jgi:hypothetical protein